MDAKIVAEELSPLGCVVRRCLAKVADVALFSLLSVLVANQVIRQPLRFDGIVPTVLSALWIVGFVISSDITFSLLFGRTPGEALTGIRVHSIEGRRLSLSQRQDRTSDALVEGTIWCFSLLPLFLRREPAPYDKGCIVSFSPLSPERIVVTVLATIGLAMACVIVAVSLGIGGLEVRTPTAVTQLMRKAGIDAPERWVNPLTGRTVLLPRNWRFADVTSDIGRKQVDFACGRNADEGYCAAVRLALQPGMVGFALDASSDTTPEALAKHMRGLLDFDVELMHTEWPYVEGAARLGLVYSAKMDIKRLSGKAESTGLLWFTPDNTVWAAMLINAPAPNQDADVAREFMLQLVESTLSQ